MIGNHQQLAAIVARLAHLVEAGAKALGEGERLGGKGNKTRGVGIEIGRGTAQFGIDAEAADAMRQQEHGVEHLFLDTAPVDVGQGCVGSEQRPETLRQFGRNLLQPAPVVGPVVNHMQAILQLPFVGHLRQQAVADDPPPFREKAGAGQDAAVGEKGDQAAGGEKMRDMAAKASAQRRVGFQLVEHRLVTARCGGVAPMLRPHDADQPAQRFQAVAVGRAKAVEGGGQWVAGQRRLAEQPAEQGAESGGHGA